MSSFICPKCGAPCLDTPYGYARGCDHHPADAKPGPSELARFCRQEYGDRSPEHGFACRLQLLLIGLGPPLMDWEDNLLILLVWAWRDSLIRIPELEKPKRKPRRK